MAASGSTHRELLVTLVAKALGIQVVLEILAMLAVLELLAILAAQVLGILVVQDHQLLLAAT